MINAERDENWHCAEIYGHAIYSRRQLESIGWGTWGLVARERSGSIALILTPNRSGHIEGSEWRRVELAGIGIGNA